MVYLILILVVTAQGIKLSRDQKRAKYKSGTHIPDSCFIGLLVCKMNRILIWSVSSAGFDVAYRAR